MPCPPFRHVEPLRRTLLQRLLGHEPPANALVALIDRLCDADSPGDVSPADVDAIGRDFRIDIRTRFRHELESLYRDYLLFCLTDRHLSYDELSNLEHLRTLFGLDSAAAQSIQRAVARHLYLQSVDDVLADGTIDPEEREFLFRLRENLAIPASIADNILDVKQRQRRAREERHGRK